MTETVQVTAVRDRDLEAILGRFGLVEKMNDGLLDCESCTRVLTWENLGAMLVKKKKLVLYCDLSECIECAAKGGK